MVSLPPWLWVLTLIATVGIAAATVVVLARAGRRAGLGAGGSALLGTATGVLFVGWGVASAVIAGHGGYLVRPGGDRVPWLPITTVAFLVVLSALALTPPVRRVLQVPEAESGLLVPHTIRVAGIVFLVAMAQGYLPALFAVPAGVGDVLAGLAALVALRARSRGSGPRAAVWSNVFGLLDLVSALVLGSLAAFVVHVTPSAQAVTELPLVLIPTVTVPLLLALHITSLRLLARGRRAVRPLPSAPEPALR
jgi:hypothetical protein